MKYPIIIISLIFSLCYIKVHGQNETVFSNNKEIVQLESKYHKFHYKSKTIAESKNYFDIKYHRFNWFIDPDTLYIQGCVTSYFEITKNNTDSLFFDFSSQLSIDSIIFRSKNISWVQFDSSSISPDVLAIPCDTFLTSGTFDSISIFYQGTPRSGDGFGSFEKDYHDSIPIIWTLSQPYGTKEWWPCKNSTTDKIDSIDIFITTPSQYRAASNGLLISENAIGTNTTYYWKHRYPISAYLIAFAVTNYTSITEHIPLGNDTLEVLNYIYPEDSFDISVKSKHVIPVMQLFDSLFGTYPFIKEKYGHAQFGWGGGMEHQTMSFMGSFSHHLTAHELAHQWFGDYITCASWQDIWLNEGFATYLTGLTYEHMFDGYYWDIWKSQTIGHIISEDNGSVFVYDTSSVSRVFDGRLSYNKGAGILHMLRWIIGDSSFYSGVGNYLSDSSLAYSTASSANLIKHFEDVADTNLTEYFSNWLYSEGHPIYTIDCYKNCCDMIITIDQISSHSSVDFFQLPIPIMFYGAEKDTLVIINNTHSGQVTTANINFIPDSIIFDPEMWLLAQLDTIYFELSIDEPYENNESFTVYPNPTNNKIIVNTKGTTSLLIELFSTAGQKIHSETPNSPTTIIDIKKFDSGIYFLEISTENGDNFTKKIIKQ